MNPPRLQTPSRGLPSLTPIHSEPSTIAKVKSMPHSRCLRFILWVLSVFLTSMTGMALADDTTPTALKKGDMIIFLGDSITAGGAGPNGYVALIKKALTEKHKDLGIEVVG